MVRTSLPASYRATKPVGWTSLREPRYRRLRPCQARSIDTRPFIAVTDQDIAKLAAKPLHPLTLADLVKLSSVLSSSRAIKPPDASVGTAVLLFPPDSSATRPTSPSP